MTDIDLDAIGALASAATEGPWRAERQMGSNGDWVDVLDAAGSPVAFGTWEAAPRIIVPTADAEFIAAARTDVPALVARVRELEAQRDAVLALHSQGPWIDADQFGYDRAREAYCDECRQAWPCATVRALTERSTT